MKRSVSPSRSYGRGIGQKRLPSIHLGIVPSKSPVLSSFSSKFGKGGEEGCCKAPWQVSAPIYEDDGKEIAAELRRMKLKERDDMLSDIHGVMDLPEETEEFLSSKLAEMQDTIDVITRKQAYNQAQFLDPSCVQDRDTRLMMLRADQYDAKKAAYRLTSFYSMKLELFGPDRLVHPIRFEDLNPGMVEELYKCRTRISKYKDRAGRTVVFTKIEYHENEWRSHFGSIFYLFMNALQNDAEAQRKGFVVIVWDDKKSKPNKEFFSVMAKASRFFKCVPFKYSCYHYCHPQMEFGNAAASFMRKTVGKYSGFRVRSHSGTFLECVYDLMGYGITFSMLPKGVDLQGELDYVQWVAEVDQRRNEEKLMPKIAKLLPTSRDCLLGRGFPYQHFVGNLYLAAIIEHNRCNHAGQSRKRKTAISMAVVQCIKFAHGGRFLRRINETIPKNGEKAIISPNSEIWMEVSDKEAREKVGHGFRAPERPDLLKEQDVSGKYIFGDEEITYIRPFPATAPTA